MHVNLSTVITSEALEPKQKQSSHPLERKEEASETSQLDFQWEDIGSGFNESSNWCIKDTKGAAESPGTWDLTAFEQQAPDSWKQEKEPKRIQDIKSPLLVEVDLPEDPESSDKEGWPFKSPCKMEEQKRKKKMTPKPDTDAASDIDSDGAPSPRASNGDKFDSGNGGDVMPTSIRQTVSADLDEDDDDEIKNDVDDENKQELTKRRSSSHSSKSAGRRTKKKSSQDPSTEEDSVDNTPSKSRSRRSSAEGTDEVQVNSAEAKKPKRRGTRSEVIGEDEGGEMATGSFHKLAKDFDKKTVRSNSKGRKSSSTSSSRTPGSAGSSSRRRRIREKTMDISGHSTSTGDDDIDEFGEEEHEIKLKGEDEEGTPNSSGQRRDRRTSTRASREQLFEGTKVLQAPGSGGRRPPTSRRGQVRRSSSERWMRAVEGVEVEEEEGEEGAPAPAPERGTELSRSVHSIRRYHSGGVGRMAAGLGSGSYHGSEAGRQRTPNRRPPRKSGNHTPTSDNSGGGSFAGDDYEYELNLSARSARTLDSIEDLEDFEHIDFQTPGIVDYDEEILELMQKANPEHTAQLQRRVNRRREAVNYDQNMPMMTRQALMTRTASTQVQRQYVDQSSIDHRRLLVRSMSNSSMTSNDQLSMSQHREQFARAVPTGRRPPPRTRSSGMAALSRSEHPYSHGAAGRPSDSDDRRRLFRAKSGASTSSFRQNQKPNRVQSISRRADGLDNSRRGAPEPEERKGSLSRAKSMHATVGRTARGLSPKEPERSVPTSIDTQRDQEGPHDKDIPKDDSSVSECSDVESDEDGDIISPQMPRRSVVPMIKVAPTPPPPRKKTDKRDFTIKRNRAKLHSMLYEHKMGVDMKDLLTQVQHGEVQRSPIHSLMMPSP